MANAAHPNAHFIGVDLSGPALRTLAVTEAGSVIARREAQLERDRVVPQIAQIVVSLKDEAPDIKAVGVAIPGLIDRATDRVVASRDLPASIRENLHSELMKATGLRFELENDANAAAYGEFKV